MPSRRKIDASQSHAAFSRPGGFDVRGCKSILDAACGNGRYSKFLLRWADPDAKLTAFDLSPNMVLRARARLKSDRVTFAIADLTKLPYADGAFDAIVCGWVLEHLPQPEMGLRELARVLQPNGKLLLLCTEDTLTGAMCSRLWHCRTYNRKELRVKCEACGLPFPSGARVKECACGAARGKKVEEGLWIRLSDRSGAAEDLAGFELGVAAGEWLREERGASWGVLLADEPFGQLDAAHRRALAGSIGRLLSPGGYEQAFVVAHHPGLMDGLPGRVRIVSDGGDSAFE